MPVPQICVDLSEAGHPVTEIARQDKAGFASYVILKGELGAWTQTNSYR
jgi:hypothetical protein